MQVILSEKEYKEMEGKIKILNHYADLFHKVQDKLQEAFLVTMQGYENKDLKALDIKIDMDKLKEIAVNYGFNKDQQEAIRKYINENN
ncbi:hypothetical protein [Clostridium beijerinckii]|jgi:hypothetical protein|uniref:Uncharacterized protein n=2 Tax=Clostridium beijerinckii TaxID=1520 RepID=A0AAE2V0C3_CLOBE|nr:hypothetical protein [Clostridium beijerinckii]ABR33544.1 hypothetical protein Cbei_1364 [Clostridium beijerinckii NCIMB 8052]AIU04860.1 hypothetical protein Cbs_1364 [Clostridium beijerinckii ATCC 35702]MBF7811960.1 hypothetical protein [Clostridium beijerinckii]NRT25189.1 putative membrane-bound dolichyl-phosphate-mannose-protein mannosyltransferase [Clostridium beijerinckii]NRT67217.1 putative membrane-bound dolichyl-phosphate-mannose-protein mannosyltransferase [Clostridium beijerinckii